MLVEIGKIQAISRELVLFYDPRGNLLNSVSIVKWIGIKDGKIRIKTDDGEFEFFVYSITEVDNLGVVTFYVELDKILTQDGEYNNRIQTIFQQLVNDVLKGCCGDENAASILFFDTFDDFPASGSVNTLYVATLEGQQGQYVWNGTQYVPSFYPHASITMYALNNFS